MHSTYVHLQSTRMCITLALLVCLIICASVVRGQKPAQLTASKSHLPNSVRYHTAVYDGQDSIYVLGGEPDANTSHAEVIKYSVEFAVVSVVGSFPNIYSGAAVMPPGEEEFIYYFGGIISGFGPSSTVYTFSTKTGRTTYITNMPESLYQVAAVWDSTDNVAYLIGGMSGGWRRDTIYRYNASNHQIDLVAHLPHPRTNVAAVWDPHRRVAYIFGGHKFRSTDNGILMFNPSKNETHLLATIPAGLHAPCATRVSDTGSHGSNFTVVIGLPQPFEFNSVTKVVGTMNVDSWKPSLMHTACAFVPKLGRIYVLGGGHPSQWKSVDDGNTNMVACIELGTNVLL